MPSLRNRWCGPAALKTGGDVVVDHVDFLIDGQVRWSEQQEPYQFNEGRLFAPWPLGGGQHQLGLHAVALDGSAVASSSVTVTVKVPPVAGLPVGTYRRTVTPADQTRVQPYRDAQHGAFGEEPPTGPWSLRIRPDGVLLLDQVPHPRGSDPFFEPLAGSDHRFTVYDSAGWLQPHPDRGNNFCEPEGSAAYRWSLSGSALTITQLQKVCADRDIVLVGTWHRV